MKRFFANQSGTALILGAVVFPILVMAMALVVDVGRLYAVQGKAQNAADAALLGAVSTQGTADLQSEMNRLYTGNFPPGYMGSSVGDIVVTQDGDCVFNVSFPVTVPTSVIGLFASDDVTFTIESQVQRGYNDQCSARRLELSLVLDNTGSMAGAKIEGLRQASRDLTNILFGDVEVLNNIRISLVPYDVAVNLGPDRAAWVQAGPSLTRYNFLAQTQGTGFVSNRNTDSPRNSFNDVSDAAPLADSAKFRVPLNAPTFNDTCNDNANASLPRMRFGMNVKSDVIATVNTMQASGCTRINVGLMWGWFTLSPSWRGVWDASLIPADAGPNLDKALVLMTDGQNTVFSGAGGTSNDDDTTAQLCSAVKAQGIKVYVVGFGSGNQINEPLLRACATQPSYYWRAPTTADLRTAFSQIADDILFNTLRLTR